MKQINKKIIFISPSEEYPGGIYHLTNRTAVELNKYKQVEIIRFRKQYPSFLYPGKKKKINDSFSEIPKIYKIIDWYSYPTWRRAFQIIKEKADFIFIPYWTTFLALPILYLAKKSKSNNIKVVIEYHNLYDHDSSKIKQFLSIIILKKLLKYSNLSIFHAKKNYQELRRWLQKSFNSIIIPHGLFDHFLSLKNPKKIFEIYDINPDFKYILMFGIIRTYKGLKYAIMAMRLLNKTEYFKYKLLVVGEIWKNISEEMKIIKKYHLGNKIKIIDKFIPDEHIQPLFEIADIVIYPYLDATQSGSLQFAFRTKKPIIATKVGEFKEVIKNRQNGILIPPKDAKKLGEALIELISNPDLLDKISIGGFKYYKDNLSWDKLINQILNKIRNL